MTYRADHEFDEDEETEAATPGNWVAAAAISVLIIATVTLTVVAGGLDLSSALLFG